MRDHWLGLGSWVLVVGLALLSGCPVPVQSAPEPASPEPGESRPASQPSAAREAEVVVFAAASLRDAFGTLRTSFEQTHPDTEVTFNFAGSQELRSQIELGSRVDVFASADTHHMDDLVAAGRVVNPVLFARNEPVLAVARDPAVTLTTFAELPTVRRVVLGAPEVPIGRYTERILENADRLLGAGFSQGVHANVLSREPNVRQVLAKVILGEAHAAIVYRTDALSAADEVVIVPIPESINVQAYYPIGVVRGASHPELAAAWIEAVLAPEGVATLARYGFDSPGTSGP